VSDNHLFDDEDLVDLEAELTETRDERISPLVLGAAVAGLLVGLFLWGSLVMSVASAAGDLFDGDDTNSGAPAAIDTITAAPSSTPEPAATGSPGSDVNRADCTAIRGTDYRSTEERTWFLANCI
jgi:hypothetical protein